MPTKKEKASVKKALANITIAIVKIPLRIFVKCKSAWAIRKCKMQRDNPFGRARDEIQQPVECIITAIDRGDHNNTLCRIGLSGRQLKNLKVVLRNPGQSDRDLLDTYIANEEGLSDGQDNGCLSVKFRGQEASANVYNAWGVRGTPGRGCAVRISSILAETLGIGLGDKVTLCLEQ